MKSEAALLRQNPLLINKIVAERLSDKLQVMMVPSDAKIFFNDVMKGGITPQTMSNQATQAITDAGDESDDPPPQNTGNDADQPRGFVRRNR
jgi:hypothetical protein